MTTTEKAAYLRGLVEGQGLNPEAGEGKLWHVVSELVSDLASELSVLRKEHDGLSDTVEEVRLGLDYLEELFQESYEDFEDFGEGGEEDSYPFGQGSFRVIDEEDDELDDDAEEEPEDDDHVLYEVECPNCGEEISFDDETLEEGSILCPSCGAALEFDLGEEEVPIEPIVIDEPDGEDF